MAESRLEREQKRLATEMNIPPVDENIYVKLLQNRDIPHETQFTILMVKIVKYSSLASHLALCQLA